MSIKTDIILASILGKLTTGALVLAMVLGSSTVDAEVIWSGDFMTGDFTQWHVPKDPDEVHFHLIPAYGRPIQYGKQNVLHVGDGSLLSLVQSPTRGAPYAAKFTVKNSSNGSEPDDCDVGGVCTRRRTELTVQQTLMDDYNGLPYMSERWAAVSVYVPADWENGSSGWGPILFNIKPRNEPSGSGSASIFSLSLGGQPHWIINHRWSELEMPQISDIPWQHQMFYSGYEGGGPYPRSDNWPDGLRDFPDVVASHSALQSVNTGGWTDWVAHMKLDERGSDKAGTGFLSVWKREGSGPWVKVLHIVPKATTRGGMTFNHGIGYRALGGYGIKVGMYMDKRQVWDNLRDRVLYIGNVKVGNANTTFSEMSHDASSAEVPSELMPPKPPETRLE